MRAGRRDNQGEGHLVLMTLDPYPGDRVLSSGAEALLIAQLSLVAKPSGALLWPMWPESRSVKADPADWNAGI